MVRQRRHASAKGVHHRDLWSRGKLVQLGSDAGRSVGELSYSELDPPSGLGLPILPVVMSRGYLDWPLLPEFLTLYPGVKTSRDDVVVDFDRDVLVRRMERYFDPAVSDATIRREIPGVMEVRAVRPGGDAGDARPAGIFARSGRAVPLPAVRCAVALLGADHKADRREADGDTNRMSGRRMCG